MRSVQAINSYQNYFLETDITYVSAFLFIYRYKWKFVVLPCVVQLQQAALPILQELNNWQTVVLAKIFEHCSGGVGFSEP
jgi:hypothetical protein